ncbi:MAG: hypothetical protein AB8G96_16220 [Phycisphaerales bacterium]
MCDYTQENVTSMDRLALVNRMLAELDDPDVSSVQLESKGRRTYLRIFYCELDLSQLDRCDD